MIKIMKSAFKNDEKKLVKAYILNDIYKCELKKNPRAS